ncbi:MAG: HD-GYP domain-containing protein [bacterium]
MELRDPYTSGHQVRVAELAVAIAVRMGLAADRVAGIRTAGLLHDIGKLAVPAEILSKSTRLTDIEFSLIKIHSQAGADLLRDIVFPWPLADFVLQHHERIDGSGYPQGLKGDETHLEAKILAVADVIEAMASHRPYRPALGIDKAIEEISKNRGVLFDPVVVDTCVGLFQREGFRFSAAS